MEFLRTLKYFEAKGDRIFRNINLNIDNTIKTGNQGKIGQAALNGLKVGFDSLRGGTFWVISSPVSSLKAPIKFTGGLVAIVFSPIFAVEYATIGTINALVRRVNSRSYSSPPNASR